MPSDNLENLFRNKVEEVQHTPPPQFNWTPDKSWDKLQPMLAGKPKPIKTWFYRGVAAGLILALMAGLALYQMPKAPSTAPTAISTASDRKKPAATSAEITLEKPLDNLKSSPKFMASSEPGTNKTAAKGKRSAHISKVAPKMALVPEGEILAAQTAPPKEKDTALLAAGGASAAESQPLKITVVLGGKTLARSQAMALAAQTEPELSAPKKNRRKDRLRLRIHHPDAGLQADTQLATTNSSQSHIGLGTRIKF